MASRTSSTTEQPALYFYWPSLLQVAEGKREVGKLSLALKAFSWKWHMWLRFICPCPKKTSQAHLSLKVWGTTIPPHPCKERGRTKILGESLLLDHAIDHLAGVYNNGLGVRKLTPWESTMQCWVKKQVNNTDHIAPSVKHTPTRAEQNCTAEEGMYYTGNYLEDSLEGSVSSSNQQSSLEGGLASSPSVWISDPRTSSCLGRTSPICPLQISSSPWSTCPVLGGPDCANGQPCSLFSGVHWQGGRRVGTRYAFPSRDVPSLLFLSGPPNTLPAASLSLVWPLFPSSLGCGWEVHPLLLDSALCAPIALPTSSQTLLTQLSSSCSVWVHDLSVGLFVFAGTIIQYFT